MNDLERFVGQRIRDFRLERRLPQRYVASALGVSQASISRIESGKEGLSVRQLVAACKLFNVLPTSFLPEEGTAQSQLRRSLVRHGAKNLVDDDQALPSARFASVKEAIRETLIAAESPRDIAGLAPVIVKNVGSLPFTELARSLFVLGSHLERRLCWLLDNILAAIDIQLQTGNLTHSDKVRYLRARTRLSGELRLISQRWQSHYGEETIKEEDTLDLDLNSPESIDEARSTSSKISKRWKIVSHIQPNDFAAALRDSLR